MPVGLASANVCAVTHALSSELLLPVGDYDVLCGCADESCTRLVQLDRDEHEILRRHPELFAVSPGHEQGCDGDVLVRADRYVLVRARERLLVRRTKELSCVRSQSA